MVYTRRVMRNWVRLLTAVILIVSFFTLSVSAIADTTEEKNPELESEVTETTVDSETQTPPSVEEGEGLYDFDNLLLKRSLIPGLSLKLFLLSPCLSSDSFFFSIYQWKVRFSSFGQRRDANSCCHAAWPKQNGSTS
jgi:hypothetical protein